MAELSLQQKQALARARARIRLAGQGEAATKKPSQPAVADSPEPFVPSGEKTSGWLGGLFGYDPKALGITPAENIAGHPITRFAVGAASPILGAAQLGAEALGDKTGTETLQRFDELRKRGQAAMEGEERGFDAAGLTGAVASPAVWKVAKALKPATTLIGKAAQGAGMGAGFGAAAPVLEGDDFAGTKMGQIETGAAIGGVLAPAAGAVAKGAAGLKNLLTPSPVKLASRAAGDKIDDVVRALKQSQSGVPGVNLTAGQASVPANSAEFAALQKMVASKDPSRFYGPAGVQGQQEAARQASLQTVSGTPEKLSAAVTARSTASKANYTEAFEQAIKRDKELREMWKNPYFKEHVGTAWKLARARGISPRKNLTEFLHFVKEGLDSKLQAATKPGGPALAATERATMSELKDQLVGWLGRKNTAYDAARQAHIEASKPINQMKLGQELEQALVAPSGAERASSFGTAVRRAGNVVSKATGRPRIEDLTPAQRKVIDALEKNLQNEAAYKDLASKGAASLDERIGATVAPPTGFFKPIVSAARSWFNKATGRITEKGLQELAPLMENPQALAKAMASGAPAQRRVMEALIQQRVLGLTGAGAAMQGQ